MKLLVGIQAEHSKGSPLIPITTGTIDIKTIDADPDSIPNAIKTLLEGMNKQGDETRTSFTFLFPPVPLVESDHLPIGSIDILPCLFCLEETKHILQMHEDVAGNKVYRWKCTGELCECYHQV